MEKLLKRKVDAYLMAWKKTHIKNIENYKYIGEEIHL